MNDIRYMWAKDSSTGKPKIGVSMQTAQSVRHEITAFRGVDHDISLSSGELSLSTYKLSFLTCLKIGFLRVKIEIRPDGLLYQVELTFTLMYFYRIIFWKSQDKKICE